MNTVVKIGRIYPALKVMTDQETDLLRDGGLTMVDRQHWFKDVRDIEYELTPAARDIVERYIVLA